MNEVITISGVDCYEKDGTAYLKLEAVARGLGFTQTQEKNGTEYTSVRWERIEKYMEESGFPHKWGKESFIPENIFYRLAMKAKNETAERFQALVADEIIPSIRKHGAYMTPQKIEEVLLNPDTIIKLATELKAEQEKRVALESKVEQDKPLVAFANSVSVGQNRLFTWMRENGYLISRKGTDYNMPTQRSMEMKLFEIKETTISHGDGHTSISKTPKVTGKGQIYFINLFLGTQQNTDKGAS